MKTIALLTPSICQGIALENRKRGEKNIERDEKENRRSRARKTLGKRAGKARS
jgi:hypothetical protein